MFYITSGFQLCFLFAIAALTIYAAFEERSILWTLVALICSAFFLGGLITWFSWIFKAIIHIF